MAICASCGAENRAGARFCDSCGSALSDVAPAREVRKTVTVFFCDVTGSTALGERIDPESLRRVMARYFETARAALERHGATVEKFIGDAVMAVFGVPAAHEDDALRALRAADELRDELATLNDELERTAGTRLELRTGVNTGEVVTGTEQVLVTGDAVNVAARLEQAARPGEILIGEETHRLARDAIEAEPVEPLVLKGKSEPLRAYRLLAVRAAPETRRDGAPMVGRTRQLKLLGDAYANAVEERSCQLFTLLGAAGVGKSRLVAEFLRSVDDATVVRGRCLSYGEGVGYWPVTEVVKQLAAGGADAAGLGAILGDDSTAGSPEEIAWAFRKLLERRATERPLVVVFDDVHWGDEAFLDLVEHVADLSRDAPILLLCLARPDLLDRRPSWGGGKLNATNVLLEPLAAAESAELVGHLLHDAALDADLRERILRSAAGNPLFVEEMVAMLAERGHTDVSVPPTIQALLAARLDQLDTAERGVLERGSVEGHVFHRGAVAALAPELTRIDGRLVSLVRKDLVRPERPLLEEDEAYRFRHILIRDTAYEALPKATRAELHERFAEWLLAHATRLVELDELVGYHLAEARRYRVELGPLDDSARSLGERAARHLLASAERAQARGDAQAARALLAQAIDLLPPGDVERVTAEIELATIESGRGDVAGADALLARAEAAAAGDERLQARVALARVEAEVSYDPTATMREALATSERALAVLERAGDDEGAARALRLAGNFTHWLGRSAEGARLWERALELAERTNPRLADDVRQWMIWELWWDETPADSGVRRIDELVASSGSKLVEATGLVIGGMLRAVQGRIEEGRARSLAGLALLRDLGLRLWADSASMAVAAAELAAGEAARAYEILTESQLRLAQATETGYLSTVVGMRAEAAFDLGRDDEALELVEETLRLAQRDDLDPHIRCLCVQALVTARRGEASQADELLAEAAAAAADTDWTNVRIDLARAQARVERLLGRPHREREALARLTAAAEEKGNLLAAGWAHARLAETGSTGPLEQAS